MCYVDLRGGHRLWLVGDPFLYEKVDLQKIDTFPDRAGGTECLGQKEEHDRDPEMVKG